MNRGITFLYVALHPPLRLSKFASFPLPSSRCFTCFTLLLQLPSLLPFPRQLNTLLHQVWSVATLHSALILLFQVGIWPLAFNTPLNSASLFPASLRHQPECLAKYFLERIGHRLCITGFSFLLILPVLRLL